MIRALTTRTMWNRTLTCIATAGLATTLGACSSGDRQLSEDEFLSKMREVAGKGGSDFEQQAKTAGRGVCDDLRRSGDWRHTANFVRQNTKGWTEDQQSKFLVLAVQTYCADLTSKLP